MWFTNKLITLGPTLYRYCESPLNLLILMLVTSYWVNYNMSLTWIKLNLGMISPIKTNDSQCSGAPWKVAIKLLQKYLVVSWKIAQYRSFSHQNLHLWWLFHSLHGFSRPKSHGLHAAAMGTKMPWFFHIQKKGATNIEVISIFTNRKRRYIEIMMCTVST